MSHLKIQRKKPKPQRNAFWPQTQAFCYTLHVYDTVPACCVNTTPLKWMADVTQASRLQKEQDPFPSPRLSEDPASPQTVNAPIQILIFCLRHYEKSLDTVIQIRTTSQSADRVSVFQNHVQTTSGCQLPRRRPSQCPSGVKTPLPLTWPFIVLMLPNWELWWKTLP